MLACGFRHVDIESDEGFHANSLGMNFTARPNLVDGHFEFIHSRLKNVPLHSKMVDNEGSNLRTLAQGEVPAHPVIEFVDHVYQNLEA